MKKAILVLLAILMVCVTAYAATAHFITEADACKVFGDFVDSREWDVELVPSGIKSSNLECVDPVDNRQYHILPGALSIALE